MSIHSEQSVTTRCRSCSKVTTWDDSKNRSQFEFLKLLKNWKALGMEAHCECSIDLMTIQDVVSYKTFPEAVNNWGGIGKEKETIARSMIEGLLDSCDEEGFLNVDHQMALNVLSWIFEDLDEPDLPKI